MLGEAVVLLGRLTCSLRVSAIAFGRERPRSRTKASTVVRVSTFCRSSKAETALATIRHFRQFAERQCLEIEISHRCGPSPECPGIDTPSRQGPATPAKQGLRWRQWMIVNFAARGVLGLGSGSPDWQGDRVWHGLPAYLCLLGHPFD